MGCHYASRAGHTEVVATLLKHGASVNCTTRSTLATPLHRAAFCGHENVIQLLLNHNSINEGMNKFTTWRQSKWESGEISRNVGSYCCDLTLKDVDGKTPLDIVRYQFVRFSKYSQPFVKNEIKFSFYNLNNNKELFSCFSNN